MHGGNSLFGIVHPRYTYGEYSKDFISRMVGLIKAAEEAGLPKPHEVAQAYLGGRALSRYRWRLARERGKKRREAVRARKDARASRTAEEAAKTGTQAGSNEQ